MKLPKSTFSYFFHCFNFNIKKIFIGMLRYYSHVYVSKYKAVMKTVYLYIYIYIRLKFCEKIASNRAILLLNLIEKLKL